MKRLHKKISIGILAIGLALGGVSLSGKSISHAMPNNNESSLLSGIGPGLLSEIDPNSLSGIDLSQFPELKALVDGGVRGLLDYYHKDSLLKKSLSEAKNEKEVELIKSVFGLGEHGNYSVIGFNVRKKRYSIPDGEKYWKADQKRFSFERFAYAARHRFDNKGDLFKKLGLEDGYIYRILIDKRYEFLIAVF